MPPSKWDEEESEESSSEEESVDVPVTVAARKKFDDEEDSDDVADNWEEEDDSEAEREKAKKAAEAKAKADAIIAANKKPKSQRIEEHREAARRRRAAAEDEDTSEDEDEDEAEKRAKLRQNEQEADLKHAQDLFADVGMGPKARTGKAVIVEDKTNPGQTIDLSKLSLFKPATKSQFDALSAALVPLLTAASSKPHYAIWMPNFVKQICAELPSTEMKKVASALTALSNEKLKEEKAQAGGKKSKASKTKVSLGATRDMGRGVADTTSYEDGLAEDDFM